MKRDVPELAADVMVLKEVDAHSFARRISLAVGSADDAEGDRHPCTIQNLACRF